MTGEVAAIEGVWATGRLFFRWGPFMAVSAIVCGPDGVDGVTYAQVNGQEVSCGTDSSGNALYLQVSTLSGDQPMQGGEVVGLQIGGAVLGVLAIAWCVRALRDFVNSTGEI
ncbi:hypothetical protein [Paraburkholderia strydomiana]|uniref:hypothetical protein n=1 Tax=Paraburkholderia TaxID=1822464 RepID=UPI0038BD94CB